MMHRIQQQFLHVEVNGTESDGLALQRSLPDLCQHFLMPTIERVLNRYAPKDGHWYIDKLDIDVGALAMDRLEQDLAELIEQTLEKLLQDKVLSKETSPEKKTVPGDRKTERQFINEVFIHFLNTGQLPWSFSLPTNQTLEQVILETWQKAEKGGKKAQPRPEVILQILSSLPARNRLILQFSAGFLKAVLAGISAENALVVEKVFQILHRTEVRGEAFVLFEQTLWETVLVFTLNGTTVSEKKLVLETWRRLPTEYTQDRLLLHTLEKKWPGISRNLKSSRYPGKSLTQPDSPPSPGPKTTTPGMLKTKIEEGLYIENAGLILLHPFLPRFFEGLGIAKESDILKPERALGLLHYLATGQLVTPEYELTLPKLLCNVPFGTPVPLEIGLKEEEKEEANALLAAVIRHWEALRSTTPDGLRGSFIIRPGKLSRRDDGDWLLQVESRTFDVLLDQLPWGIGMIKLPWMKRMLSVEWG